VLDLVQISAPRISPDLARVIEWKPADRLDAEAVAAKTTSDQ
jgi:hypothetical protein